MDDSTETFPERFDRLRRSLDVSVDQARRAIEATRKIQASETMQFIAAQQRLRESGVALRQSRQLMR